MEKDGEQKPFTKKNKKKQKQNAMEVHWMRRRRNGEGLIKDGACYTCIHAYMHTHTYMRTLCIHKYIHT